jgi:hypothetical protein
MTADIMSLAYSVIYVLQLYEARLQSSASELHLTQEGK